MMPVVQKLVMQGGSVARPKTGQIPLQNLRINQDDWDDMRAILGRKAPEIVREFIRWYLRRPGARLPARPTVDEVDEIAAKRQAEKQASENGEG